jgi:hypothetical protein
MTEVKFKVLPGGEPFEFEGREAEKARPVVEAARSWAEANGLERLTFLRGTDADRKLVVQFDDEPPLSSWVDAAIFREGRASEIEALLDYARGEHRRRMAGFTTYDR